MAASKNARIALALSILLTAGLYAVPYGHIIAWPLVLLSTLAHQLGHGLTAALTGQEFEAFYLYADASGAAAWRGDPNRIVRALIAAGGLVGPAIAALACFAAGRSPKASRLALGALGFGLLAALVVVVRNPFGWAFIGLVALGSLALAFKAKPEFARFSLVFFGVQLALSVFSRSDYLFTETANTAQGPMPSDVAHIAEALFLPYWFWGGMCGLVSVVVLGLGLVSFLRK
jgi:hypothetical protein